jgi:D-3-phosphoglycerate dehydrogenase
MALAEKLGRLVGQIVGEDVRSIAVEVEGAAAELNRSRSPARCWPG